MQFDRSDSHFASRAASYVRASTEHQQYSIENQSAAIQNYAAAHRMQIVCTYTDAGKTGLTLRHRPGLQKLLDDVENHRGEFTSILVLDVSRWGRFQDADESAYYEYRCRKAKIDVHYCAESFANDMSLPSTLLKSLKRAMAGEYSRELSAKVFAGKARLIEKGFRQGGPAGYGLRRRLQDERGVPKGLLQPGEHKSIATDRVVLVPGPPEEIAIVKEIYGRYIAGEAPRCIADDLNQRKVAAELGRPWTRFMIYNIVSNPKYIGANVFNRASFRLRKAYIKNPPEMWVRRDGAFEPIIQLDLFARAQKMVAARNHRYSEEELLQPLREILTEAGTITASLIDDTPGTPSRASYWTRFGGLLGAYQRIGFTPDDDYSYLETNHLLDFVRQKQLSLVFETLETAGARFEYDTSTHLFTVNQHFTVHLVVARCHRTKNRTDRWKFRLDRPAADLTVVARLDFDYQTIIDYHLFPHARNFPRPSLDLGRENSWTIGVFRQDDLSLLARLSERKEVECAVTQD
jgi:DNA invertase Pin-like site-specific DNA recombinase